ncbi:zeta toxin family protein [Puia sp.]|jgi:predicted ABC-type ATPase|uniref:zeta toxin family protein n=1 Tax=Puia sp. TaxID=2045100 RepID=UPI002F3FF38F
MPTIYVIAGPNGIGKTTSFYNLLPKNIPVINSDEIAKEAKADKLISSNSQEYSNRVASQLIDEQINKLSSFAIETNLSDVETWKFLIKLHEIGYEVHLMYISTDQIVILNDRIKERVLLGEHYVRPDIVEQRYICGLNLLNHFFEFADILQLFDNSTVMTQIGEFRCGECVMLADSLPKWVLSYLGNHIEREEESGITPKDLTDIDAVRKAYQALKSKPDKGD